MIVMLLNNAHNVNDNTCTVDGSDTKLCLGHCKHYNMVIFLVEGDMFAT